MVAHAPPSGQSNVEWLANYQRTDVEVEEELRKARRAPWKWQHLVRRTLLANHAEKHVLRVLADHAWAGPDPDGRGREDGVCVLLRRTIARESGLSDATVKRALSGLVRKQIIEREGRGRRGGGRGANLYRILPSNAFEDRANGSQ